MHIYTHACIYLRKMCYVYILNKCKYFQNINCMCVSLYKHNLNTQYTHTHTQIYYINKTFILDAINHCPALAFILINHYKSYYWMVNNIPVI